MKIDARGMHFKDLNQAVRATGDERVVINNCCGQRYIASGLRGKSLIINGTPGNALGAYLNGCTITIWGNGQDAIGDTMNDGEIIIHGSCGDACGYAMRGGSILVQGNAGYRAGIHMKAYQDKQPSLIIGGTAGSFLGEYQAGGSIVVLDLAHEDEVPIVGYFCGTGMHGGKIYLRCQEPPDNLPAQVAAKAANEEDMAEISQLIDEFCVKFVYNKKEIMDHPFFVLTPNTHNPYKQLYTHN